MLRDEADQAREERADRDRQMQVEDLLDRAHRRFDRVT